MQTTPEEVVRQCLEVMRQQKMVSISLFQRQLGLGYTRAARILDILEARGRVGPAPTHSRARS
jgi:S-DNA-T family DNA segregation ATPase FtsK/SpoIIIE